MFLSSLGIREIVRRKKIRKGRRKGKGRGRKIRRKIESICMGKQIIIRMCRILAKPIVVSMRVVFSIVG